MKKSILLSVMLGALPLSMMAQDDLYFTPKKSVKEAKSSIERVDDDSPTYYIGSDRSDDEYNRLGEYGSHYEVVGTDSLGNDIIEFVPGKGYSEKQEESAYDEESDYEYSRRMSRFEDLYCPYDPWFYTHYGFGPYWRSYYWDAYYPWYTGWYDPWYYGYRYGYYGWYSPWYYSWSYPYYGWGYPYYGWGYGWYTPYYGGTGYSYWAYNDRNHGVTGTSNHGDVYRPGRGGHGGGSFGGARGSNGTRSASASTGTRGSKSKSRGTFGGNRSRSTYSTTNTRSNENFGSNPSGKFGVSRGHDSNFGSSGTFGGSYSGSSSSGSYGGGGSTRSSGGGGGGHFGGRR